MPCSRPPTDATVGLGEDSQRTKVVAGILQDELGRVLIADRTRSHSMHDYWEFPGGKINPGESADGALRRELVEELGIEIGLVRHFLHVEHDYPDLNVAIDFYLVTEWEGTPDGREGQQLKWVDKTTLDLQNLLPADAPLVELLKNV